MRSELNEQKIVYLHKKVFCAGRLVTWTEQLWKQQDKEHKCKHAWPMMMMWCGGGGCFCQRVELSKLFFIFRVGWVRWTGLRRREDKTNPFTIPRDKRDFFIEMCSKALFWVFWVVKSSQSSILAFGLGFMCVMSVYYDFPLLS